MKTVLLSFDIEEFDMPLEYQGNISFDEQLSVSREGLVHILNILRKFGIKATFFTTVIFAEHHVDLLTKLIEEGHELASHTWHHSKFKEEDLKKSRERLDELFNAQIKGMRMPRLVRIPALTIKNAGYVYDSSINPTYLPGRYNNISVNRTIFVEDGIVHIPASVSTWRIPLFWLSFHNFPLRLYKHLLIQAINKDEYVNLYFHPWEFSDISKKEYRLPTLAKRNTGEAMQKRFENLLKWMSAKNYKFETYSEFINAN